MDSQKPILLILDLDHTLIYATGNPPPDRQPDFTAGPYYLFCRPYLAAFLTTCSKYFDLAIWSSGGSDYVEAVVAKIMPEGVQPLFVWSGEQCEIGLDLENMDICSLKDLRRIEGRGFDLDRVLIVEDTPGNVRRFDDNAIYVTSYTGQPQDQELLLLERYLVSIHASKNVRRLKKRKWRQSDG